jgi:hypothetical protein
MSSTCHIDARVVVHVDRGDTMSLKWGHQWTYCSFPRLYIRMEPRRNIIDRGKPKKNRRKSCPSGTLSTINPTWTDMGCELGTLR